MSPPKYELVIQDCDVALSLDGNYVKAINRRGTALEGIERYEEALRGMLSNPSIFEYASAFTDLLLYETDFTAATILDRFTNQASAQSVERVLKKLATQKATEILAQREPRLPSFTFISAYFAAFRPRPHPTLPENPTTGDETLLLGLQALDAANYTHAVTLINEAQEQGISWDEGKAAALNLRGTFKYVFFRLNSK